ncbi:hypothetical protein ABZY45_23880 [Streptomyces sp. NPDC006516]|uniref:hypothetical protein n=1 Tax=Streptomyces sp. NPDC006516 TaxID=3154309 RepID=UPI0033AB5925
MRKAVFPGLVVLAVLTAGCSSASDAAGQQRLTEQRENYCTQLGTWQKARNAAEADPPDASEFDEVGALAEDAFLAMRPIRKETVGGGRSLGEATSAAMHDNDSEAEGRVVDYCTDNGFETLTR